MQLEHQGRSYRMIRTGDPQRDGMGLELYLGSRVVAEVFYSNATQEFAISIFAPALPLEIIEQLITAAKFGLLPEQQVHGL